MIRHTKMMPLLKIVCILCMLLLCAIKSSSQQTDSLKFSLKSKSKKANKLPEIKANVQSYKPFYNMFPSSGNFVNYAAIQKNNNVAITRDKLLTILKIYPNPVENQLNIILAIGKDNTQTSIKILDVLGNEVVTLLNERLSVGEQTKSFSLPTKINPGIYFLRVIAGSESQVKRISVL